LEIALKQRALPIARDVTGGNRNGTTNRPLIALILAGVFLGCSPIFVRISTVGPITTAFWRLSLALIPLIVLFRVRTEEDDSRKQPRVASEYMLAALPGFFLAGDLAVWHVSLHMTSVANATLLANMAPIFVTFGSWIFFRQRVTRIFLAGLALSIVGIVVLKGGLSAIGAGHILGDLLALSASVFYAGYIMAVGWARKRFQSGAIMLCSTISATVCTLPVARSFENGFFPATLMGWAILCGLAWISQTAGQSLITYSLGFLPAAFSSLTLLIQPVIAAMIAWVLLGEALTASQIAGGLVIIAGIGLARRG
jgi:drug/metabolite transporter (DMT)-like permease